MRNIHRETDAIFTMAKLGILFYIASSIAVVAFVIYAIVQTSNYIADECNGSVSYCAGKVFSDSKSNFNKGLNNGN